MPSPLANQTIARIQQALRTNETASLPEIIKLIEELSGRAFSISVQELADLISHDTIVTAKVIQAANTFGYNPFGQTVTTVTQAIHVVGFNKIRNLALSMLLIENAMHASQPESLRESAALALCSGLFAQALTSIHPEQDAEQAFIFACLRHYGRLLLTTFLPDEFQQIQQRPVDESEAAAARRIFGLTPLELTHHLFEQSRLPRTILRCLQDVPKHQLDQPATTAEERLTAITHFASSLGEVIVSSRVGSNDFAEAAEKIRHDFSGKLGLSPDSIGILVKVVDQNLRNFTHTYGSRAVASGVVQRIGERARQTEPMPALPNALALGATHPGPNAPPPTEKSTPGTATGAAESPPQPGAGPAPQKPGPDAVAILTEGLMHLTELTVATVIDLPAMDMVALSAARRAFALQDSVLLQRDSDGKTFTATLGLGELFNLIRGRPLVSSDRRDVFGISISRREDVLIRDTADPKIQPFIPEWLRSAGAITTFILLPMVNETGAIALIVGTRTGPTPLQPSPRELQLLKAIRQHLVAARRLAGVKS